MSFKHTIHDKLQRRNIINYKLQKKSKLINRIAPNSIPLVMIDFAIKL